MTKDEGRELGGFALAVLLSVAGYHLSVLGVFFLLPLQWLKVHRGQRSFVAASMLAAAGIAGVEVVLRNLSHHPWTVLDTAVLGLPVLMIAGWVAIVAMEGLGWRFLYRLVAVTAVAGLVAFPTLASLLHSEAFVKLLQQSFATTWNLVFQSPGLDTPGLGTALNQSEFFELLKQMFLGSFLVVFFLFWAFTHRISRVLRPNPPRTLREFFVPTQGVWLLLGLWGLILAQGLLLRSGVKWDWGFGMYVVLNAAWIALVVHALAGWGILHCLMDQWRLQPWVQGAVRVLLIVLLLVPGAGQVAVLVGLPLLAVLELWVNFRNRQGVGL